jgi:hypothetical protein
MHAKRAHGNKSRGDYDLHRSAYKAKKKNVKAGKHENAAIWVWQLYTRA